MLNDGKENLMRNLLALMILAVALGSGPVNAETAVRSNPIQEPAVRLLRRLCRLPAGERLRGDGEADP